MRTLRTIAFLVEEFTKLSPARQLMDRFLIGYPRDGAMHQPACEKLSAYVLLGTLEPEVELFSEDRRLVHAPNAAEAVAGADAVVVVSRRPGAVANERLLRIALEGAASGAACFVHGALSHTLAGGRELWKLARARQIQLMAGTSLAVTWRLPEVELPRDTDLAEGLIVVQVNPLSTQTTPPLPPTTLGGAELHAMEGLWPVIERRRGGESGVRAVRFLENAEVWRAGDKGLWSWPLLAAALSRSHTPQGDAVLDGRTQDLVGLGLVPKLARHPRGWLLEHRDGFRSALLVLDGVVADFNFAVRGRDQSVVSAQLFRAPAPAEHHFSRLTAVLEDFFQTGRSPWPVERALLIAGLLETFRSPASRSGKRVETPELNVAYST
jgi:hypothetical protein